MSTEEHWVLIALALISAVGAVGAAWAGNKARTQSARLDERNTSQHNDTGTKLDAVAERQQWVINQLADIRQALLQHVIWEQGAEVKVEGMSGGKYHALEERLAQLEAEVSGGRRSPLDDSSPRRTP